MNATIASIAPIAPIAVPQLIDTPHLERPDDFYQALIEAHAPLQPAESHAFNARLVLLLANHIGSLDVLRQALHAAAMKADPAPATPN